MSGGRGRIGGTIVGAFVIGILSDGLIMMGVSAFWQMVIKGLVIVAAVVIDQAQSRLQARVVAQETAKVAELCAVAANGGPGWHAEQGGTMAQKTAARNRRSPGSSRNRRRRDSRMDRGRGQRPGA